jgi:hypothetical protein
VVEIYISNIYYRALLRKGSSLLSSDISIDISLLSLVSDLNLLNIRPKAGILSRIMASSYVLIGIISNPGGPEAPLFIGEDITDFLRKWEDLYKDRGKDLDRIISRIPNYYKPIIALYIRHLVD